MTRSYASLDLGVCIAIILLTVWVMTMTDGISWPQG
jgi:hypothetical protein